MIPDHTTALAWVTGTHGLIDRRPDRSDRVNRHHPDPDALAALTAAHGPALARLLGAQAADVTTELFAAHVFEAVEDLHRAGRHGEAEDLEDILVLLTDAALEPGTDRARALLEAADGALRTALPAILATTPARQAAPAAGR
ncbi:hypothetical protein ACFV1L_22085 [Kitasatospora sp. NPDC059646]|uniref:hypothetical protein n=1 Tax=Kitasatospora sp. NPDC059646 TaxID=3346893 RepID=UPI00369DC9B5